ncbi:MAG: hypothetical protein ACFFDN_49755 [Candidatus Hodarchaeota archaeon]
MKLIQYFKERNVQLGIVIFAIITFIAYVVSFRYLPYLYLVADVQFLIGAIIGVIFALQKRDPDQSILKCGIIVGIVGGILSSLIMSLYDLLIYMMVFIDFFSWFGFLLTSGIPIGLIISALISAYYMFKEVKGEKEEDDVEEDFFKDLIEK